MTEFQRRPSWTTFVDLVDAEVKGSAPNGAAVRLREPDNLIPWLRALNYLKAEVDMHIADSKRRLQADAPLPGDLPSREYVAAKRAHDELHARRVRYLRRVTGRLEECRYLIDLHEVAMFTFASAVEKFACIEELLMRDDIDGALGVARMALEKIKAVS